MWIIGLLYVLIILIVRLYFLIGPIIFLIGSILLIIGVPGASMLLYLGAFSVFVVIVFGVSIPLSLPKDHNSAIFLSNCYAIFFIALTIISFIFSGNSVTLGICCSLFGATASAISIGLSFLKVADSDK